MLRRSSRSRVTCVFGRDIGGRDRSDPSRAHRDEGRGFASDRGRSCLGPHFWPAVVRRCRSLHRAGTTDVGRSPWRHDRANRERRTCVAGRDSPARGFRRSCTGSHDVGDVVSMRQDDGFEARRHATRHVARPGRRLRRSPIVAYRASRLRLNRCRKSRKRSSCGLVQRRPVLRLISLTEVEILADGHGCGTGRLRPRVFAEGSPRTHGQRRAACRRLSDT